jgi:hypothetical protein
MEINVQRSTDIHMIVQDVSCNTVERNALRARLHKLFGNDVEKVGITVIGCGVDNLVPNIHFSFKTEPPTNAELKRIVTSVIHDIKGK